MGISSWVDQSVFPHPVLRGIVSREGHVVPNEETVGNKWKAVMPIRKCPFFVKVVARQCKA